MKIFPERITFITGSSTGGLFLGPYITAVAAAGANNDFNPGGAPPWPGTLAAPYGRLDITAPAAWNLTGLLAGFDGQLVRLRNTSGFLGTLNNQNAGSAAANRFASDFDLNMPDQSSVDIVYYAGSINRWTIGT